MSCRQVSEASSQSWKIWCCLCRKLGRSYSGLLCSCLKCVMLLQIKLKCASLLQIKLKCAMLLQIKFSAAPGDLSLLWNMPPNRTYHWYNISAFWLLLDIWNERSWLQNKTHWKTHITVIAYFAECFLEWFNIANQLVTNKNVIPSADIWMIKSRSGI